MNEQTIKTIHNTYAYCTSFFSLYLGFKMKILKVELVQQRKKKKGKVKKANSKHEERREH
jgi:hypothetical protein